VATGILHVDAVSGSFRKIRVIVLPNGRGATMRERKAGSVPKIRVIVPA
jgi:hypothetical protein